MANWFDKFMAAVNNLRPSHIIDNITQANEGNRGAMYRAARAKLTVFYVIGLVVLSLFLTISIRALAEHEFEHEDTVQRGTVHRLLFQNYSVPIITPNNDFNQIQRAQDETVSRHLNEYVLAINVLVLVLGGVVAYWYAGRTLKPIEEAHEAQARFASDASHELRTPLANLKLENEIFLRQKSFTSSDARRQITSNLEEVQRLENLASNLLALSHYETADLPLEPLNIQPVVAQAATNSEKSLREKRLTLQQQLPPAAVLGHSDSLIQLVSIILDNAIKYSPKGRMVYLDGKVINHHYQLSIRDQGPGIAETDLPHVFERLFRGDKSRTGKTHGYGLGLSLAREIAKANEASIAIRNYPDGGTQCIVTFTLTGVA